MCSKLIYSENYPITLFDANAFVINYSYDQAGNLDSREHVNINEVVYTSRDKLGRIDTLSRDTALDAEYDVAQFDYIGARNDSIFLVDANMTLSYVYDNYGQMLEINNHPEEPNEDLEFHYTYDDNGNRKQMKHNHLATVLYDKYTYDNLDRLTNVDYGETSGWAMVLPEVFKPYLLAVEEWLAFDVTIEQTVPNRPILTDELRDDYERLFDQTLSTDERDALIGQLFNDDIDIIHASVVENNGETSEITEDESGWTQEAVSDADGTLLRWEIYKQKGNGKKDYMAQIYLDAQERITLFRMYLIEGGWVEIVATYDTNDEIATNVANTYDKQGKPGLLLNSEIRFTWQSNPMV
jgi:YD repeat-containing protein